MHVPGSVGAKNERGAALDESSDAYQVWCGRGDLNPYGSYPTRS